MWGPSHSSSPETGGTLVGKPTYSPCPSEARPGPSMRSRDYSTLTVVLNAVWINGTYSPHTSSQVKVNKESHKSLSLPLSWCLSFYSWVGPSSYYPKSGCGAPGPSSFGPPLSLLFEQGCPKINITEPLMQNKRWSECHYIYLPHGDSHQIVRVLNREIRSWKTTSSNHGFQIRVRVKYQYKRAYRSTLGFHTLSSWALDVPRF